MKRLAKALVMLALTFSVTLVVGAVAPILLVPPEQPRPKPNDSPVVEAVTVPDLTEAEKETVMNIIKSDVNVSRILEKGNWTAPLMGPWTNGTERLGAVALIKFNGSVWVEGTFYDPFSGISYTEKLWAGNVQVFVDLRANRVVGLELGMGRSEDKAPITDEKLVVAERIAMNHTLVKTLGQNIESYLTAVYYTPDYPYGIAFFSMRSNQGEVLVAVDLDKMVVVEKYTSRVMGRER